MKYVFNLKERKKKLLYDDELMNIRVHGLLKERNVMVNTRIRYSETHKTNIIVDTSHCHQRYD